MAYKLGFVLSMLFLSVLFCMVGDLMSIQFIYTDLDAVSVTVGYVISSKGCITEEVINIVHDQANANIVEIGKAEPIIGEVIQYKIFKTYNALVIKQVEMEIAVVRSVVIGYYR